VYLALALSLYCVHAFEPVPQTAMPVTPPDPIKGYAIVDHGKGVYFLTEGAYWSMAVVSHRTSHSSHSTGNGHGSGNGNKGSSNGYGSSGSSGSSGSLLVIDAPIGFFNASSFMAAIREILHKARVSHVSDMLYSHQHTDHIGNAYLVKQAFPDVRIHASTGTCDRLKARHDSHRPQPTHCYAHNFTLSSFGISAHDIGDAHSWGNRAIYHAQAKVLMYIDIVFPGWTMFRDLAQAEYTPAFIEAHDKILQYDFDVYVGGHLTRLGNRQDVKIQREYVHDLVANGQYALAHSSFATFAASLGTFNPTSPNYLNYWLLWDSVQQEQVNTCVQRTLAKWSGRLGAVDVWTYTHCFRVIESTNID